MLSCKELQELEDGLLEQIDLAEENWDTNVTEEDGFNTLREMVKSRLQEWNEKQ